VSPLFYIVANDVIAAAKYLGYGRLTRPVGGLSETYAPSRPVLISLRILFELLMISFWIGLWRAAPHNRALRVTTVLMIGVAALGLLAFPFPMVADQVPVANTMRTIIWGVVTPLLMLADMGVSAAVFGKRFHFFVIPTMVALVTCSAGETALWFGVAERALIGVWLLQVAVLATTLLRAPATTASRNVEAPMAVPRVVAW
jgi:hypothetical protein